MSEDLESCLPIFTNPNSRSNSPNRSRSPQKGEPHYAQHLSCFDHGSNEHADSVSSDVEAGRSNSPNRGHWVPGGSPNESWQCLGGVNTISPVDREFLEKERERLAKMSEEEVVRENVSLLMGAGYDPNWEQREMKGDRVHHHTHNPYPSGHPSSVNMSPTRQPKLRSPPNTESANQSLTLQPNSGARTHGRGGGSHDNISAGDIAPVPWHRPSGGWGHPELFEEKHHRLALKKKPTSKLPTPQSKTPTSKSPTPGGGGENGQSLDSGRSDFSSPPSSTSPILGFPQNLFFGTHPTHCAIVVIVFFFFPNRCTSYVHSTGTTTFMT